MDQIIKEPQLSPEEQKGNRGLMSFGGCVGCVSVCMFMVVVCDFI